MRIQCIFHIPATLSFRGFGERGNIFVICVTLMILKAPTHTTLERGAIFCMEDIEILSFQHNESYCKYDEHSTNVDASLYNFQ